MAIQPLIHKKDVILVKPAEPTPFEVLSLSTIDNDRTIEVLYQTVYAYKMNSLTSLDPAMVIKEALSKVLVYYYPLAGKLKRDDGKLRITCNADGVPFLEAYADCELSSLNYLDGIDSGMAKLLAFDWPSESECGYHPLLLSVTKFSCGGFTIGMVLSHSVCDGFGAAQFYKAMAELASGKSEPMVKPVWERERLVGAASKDPILPPIDMSTLANSPFLPSTVIAQESFYLSGETIGKLKMSFLRELEKTEDANFTTVEILGAYVWRSRSRALQLTPNGKTMFSMVMGIRNVLNPPLDAGYYGNAFFCSSDLVLTVRDLNELPLSKVAKLIKESKKALTSSTDFVPKTLDNLETIIQQKVDVEISDGACMELTDWRQLGLMEEVDFGWKEMVNMVPLLWNNFSTNLCMFLPPCKVDSSMKTKGGVRVLVTLPKAAMAKMKEEMECLNQLGVDHIEKQSKPAMNSIYHPSNL
ncbi:spermidine coumaroyl-CoA acyltransferase-like [Heracleum sosnowskyi]|uniref:Spermidine coumaroyl-CoA acyltransferase-like n=1 Tax=Heracleum sosnowskyi TaxID=360622 RepID=A0AAD8J432_9APIA|nr:spermidine coumaroyl-CoA acyltransferase-like [Heracleum sosnowskyi]